MKPLLSFLLQGQYFWSENGRWVGLDSSVCVVPQVNSSQFPKVVIDVLIRCGKTVVVLPDIVWEAVKFLYGSSCPFTTIIPSVVRQAIRVNSQSYTTLSRVDKLKLLHYCLDDRNYYDLNGLTLLPTVVSTFVTFITNQAGVKLYVCDKNFLDTKLLANNSSTLVNVEGEDDSLHHKLIEVANSRCTQLQMLTPESVAVLLKQTSPFQNGWCCYGSAGGFYNENWLKTFWRWVGEHSLSCFVDIPLVPICGSKNAKRFKVVAYSLRVFMCNKNAYLCFNELVAGAEKLGCYLTCSEDFPYLHHYDIDGYVPQFSQSCLLNVAQTYNYDNVVLMHKEANAIQYFLFHHPITLNSTQKSVALKLRMFTTLKSDTLTSLHNANSSTGGRSGTFLIIDPDRISEYMFALPPNPPIIICERSIADNLNDALPNTCLILTKLLLIVNVILSAIERKKINQNSILKVTSMLLEPKEYNSLASISGGGRLTAKLRSLKYLPTSCYNKLFSPCEVYDPTDPVVKELFEGQNVFPIAPFSSAHFPVLKQLGTYEG